LASELVLPDSAPAVAVRQKTIAPAIAAIRLRREVLKVNPLDNRRRVPVSRGWDDPKALTSLRT
jgi:hypothetical protein